MQAALLDAHNALFDSIKRNDIESAQKLLAIGLSIDFVDPNTHDTAFLMACGYRRLEIIRLLKIAGANIHAVNKKDGNSGIMNALDDRIYPESNTTNTKIAPRGELIPVLELLISPEYKLDVSLPNYDGHIALKFVDNNSKAHQLLVKEGLSLLHVFNKTVTKQGKKFIDAGDSMLIVAARTGNYQIAEAIVNNRLASDADMIRALQVAQENNHQPILELIKKALSIMQENAQKAFNEIEKDIHTQTSKEKKKEKKKQKKKEKVQQEKIKEFLLQKLNNITESTTENALNSACKELALEYQDAQEKERKALEKAFNEAQQKIKKQEEKHRQEARAARKQAQQKIEAEEKKAQELLTKLPLTLDTLDFNDFKCHMNALGATVEAGSKTDGFETSIVSFSKTQWIKYYKVNEKLWAQRESALILQEQHKALAHAESIRLLAQKKNVDAVQSKQETAHKPCTIELSHVSQRDHQEKEIAQAKAALAVALPHAQHPKFFALVKEVQKNPVHLPILTAPRPSFWNSIIGINTVTEKKSSTIHTSTTRNAVQNPCLEDVFTHIRNADRCGVIHCLQQASQPLVNQVHQSSGDTPLLYALSWLEKNSHTLSEQQTNDLINTVLLLLMHGANPLAHNKILHYCAMDLAISHMNKTGNKKLVDILLKAGVSPEQRIGATTVQQILTEQAQKNTQPSDVKSQKEYAANEHKSSHQELQPAQACLADSNAKIKEFLNSAAAGNLIKIQMMLDKENTLINAQCAEQGYENNTALHETLYWLLGVIQKKEQSHEDEHQKNNYINIALYLLKKGADYTIKNRDNICAKDYARAYYSITGDGQLLKVMGEFIDSTQQATQNTHEQQTTPYQQPSAKTQEKNLETMLNAAFQANPFLVDHCIHQLGVDINGMLHTEAYYGNTALLHVLSCLSDDMIKLDHRHTENLINMVAFLLDRKANPLVKNAVNETPIKCAIKYFKKTHDPRLVHVLLDSGVPSSMIIDGLSVEQILLSIPHNVPYMYCVGATTDPIYYTALRKENVRLASQ
jgi:hypothetical protein